MNFWTHLDQLVSEHRVIIDRPRGTAHPRYTDSIYPIDYGYLEDTLGGDRHGIDVWVGSQLERTVQAIIVTIDLLKANSEIKVILGCTEPEIENIYAYHCTYDQQGLLIIRP